MQKQSVLISDCSRLPSRPRTVRRAPIKRTSHSNDIVSSSRVCMDVWNSPSSSPSLGQANSRRSITAPASSAVDNMVVSRRPIMTSPSTQNLKPAESAQVKASQAGASDNARSSHSKHLDIVSSSSSNHAKSTVVAGVQEKLGSNISARVPSTTQAVLDSAPVGEEERPGLFSRARLVNFALYSMAAVVFAVGIAAAVRSFMVDNQISQTVSAQSSEEGGLSADEKEPDEEEVRAYSVAPDMPKYISIPKLDKKAIVKSVGVRSDGALDSPGNVHHAGWYRDSVKPGSPGGASLIDGHVSGPTRKGVFFKLETLSSGDIVIVEKGDGTKLEYKVVATEVVKTSEVNMNKLMISHTTGTHGLNLITCTGKFDKASNSYEDRALVYTEFVRSY